MAPDEEVRIQERSKIKNILADIQADYDADYDISCVRLVKTEDDFDLNQKNEDGTIKMERWDQ